MARITGLLGLVRPTAVYVGKEHIDDDEKSHSYPGFPTGHVSAVATAVTGLSAPLFKLR